VVRDPHREDRRKICLQLTLSGKEELEAAYGHTQAFLAEKMSDLKKDELDTLTRSMQILKGLFMSDPGGKSAHKTRK
jgi:DNA-binding MarR family transcriptional regulator